ncbi:unnamed protein product [Brachionus calyciflorus]|uniref:Protein kinase domain-containing protein n=1 Tax=Brachionus calyciflorus TaxID=104777 RepID=A0A813QG44_9BILA|nr:unnamed protein product [Brachionus calyciflorus]
MSVVAFGFNLDVQKSENNTTILKNPESNIFINRNSILIGDKIGSGSYSLIYLGFYNDLSLHVAVKTETSLKLTLKQIKKMLKLSHENLIKFYGVCPLDNSEHLIIMELASPKGSLRKFIDDAPFRIKLSTKLNWLKQIAYGMQYLHYNEITHRDLKADNIVFDKYPENFHELESVKLKIIDISTMYGTPTHMSPEAFEDCYNFKSDVWSFGCLAWEIMTQFNLKEYFKQISIFELSLQKTGMKLSDIDFKPIKDLIEICWEKDTDLRPSFSDILIMLDKINSEE